MAISCHFPHFFHNYVRRIAVAALLCIQVPFVAQVAQGQCPLPAPQPPSFAPFGECWTWEKDHRRDLVPELKRKAAAGDPTAAATLGDCFDSEHDPLSRHFAATWYLKAAELGDVYAQAKIGEIYEFGDGIWANHAKALAWVHKAIDGHDLGIATAIGNRYFHSHATFSPLALPTHVRKALFWYHVAADAGDEAAMLAIGQIWFSRATVLRPLGSTADSMADFAAASVWFRLTADTLGPAALSLGYQYVNGYGVPQDFSEAERLYRKAGELGMGYQPLENFLQQHPDPARDVKAVMESYHQDRISRGLAFQLFERTFGASSNYAEEIALFRSRAKTGDPVAQVGLGLRYEYGINVQRNWVVGYALYNLVRHSSSPLRKDLPDFTKSTDPQRAARIQNEFAKNGPTLLNEMEKPGNLLKAIDEFLDRNLASTDPEECYDLIQD
jgi:TPR repeat protein